MATTSSLYERHRSVMPAWVEPYYDEPVSLVRGEGRTVWDADGRDYLDFFGGILTTMTAHGAPEVRDAVAEQASKLIHSSTLYLIEPMVELAERIADLSGIPDAKVFFTSSGTEAVDAALLMATCHRRSDRVLALRHSYHGRSFSAMSVTGNRHWASSHARALDVTFVHTGYQFRSPFRGIADRELTDICVADLEDLLDTVVPGDVACMIAEPIQGVGGFTVPPPGFFAAFKKVLDERGILFVSDEVQTGWGRTGQTFWGIGSHGVDPDLMVFAKGLGNGLPIGGVVGRADIIDALPHKSISTFGGGPLVAAGALANLDLLLRDELQDNAWCVGERLLGTLRSELSDHAGVGEVRGKALMIGLELVGSDGFAPDARLASAVLEGTRRKGVLIGVGGLHGNVLRIAPPMSVTTAEADQAASAIVETLVELEPQSNSRK